MALPNMPRDLVVVLKNETVLNIGILNKLKPMPEDLSRQVLSDNVLEKPTQNLFYHISHYLVGIINPTAIKSHSWPLYDSKVERAYRNDVAGFISEYSSKGLLSPVMPSYLVNPGCFKVTKLIFQMSQLAVQKLLESRKKKDSQKKLYTEITEKYKSQNKDSFLQQIETETELILSKFSNYLEKRTTMEKISKIFHAKIIKMEARLNATNAQKFLDNLIDKFIEKHELDDTTKAKILQIKNVKEPTQFFDSWLSETDHLIDEMESKWSEKVSPFMQTCKEAEFCTESLMARRRGEVNKNTYMIEYNHKTDEINTTELQNHVNSQQKYILKNIVKNEKLNFPNLIRGFLISIDFILKDVEIGDEIHQFNIYLEEGTRKYSETVEALRQVITRVMNAQARLKPSPVRCNRSVSMRDFPEIPPLRDFSDCLCTRELQCQQLFDSFTPQSMSKHQFNLGKRNSLHTFVKPQIKPFFVTTLDREPREDIMKSKISCRMSLYDNSNSKQNHLSVISQPNRANETIAECSSGFTKQQMLRLLSTKKSSMKTYTSKTDRKKICFKKEEFFNESNSDYESNGSFRSYSSPNLYENRKEKSIRKSRHRNLPKMQEGLPLLEVSGIDMLDKDSSCDTPKDGNLGSSKKLIDNPSIPTIKLTSEPDENFHKNLDFKVDLNTQFLIDDKSYIQSKGNETKIETPNLNAPSIHKTSSLEKIINRFRKIQAKTFQEGRDERSHEFLTIAEENQNTNSNIDFSAKRLLLPDLLSPSCSVTCTKPTSAIDNICMDEDDENCMDWRRKTRVSLGTVLGVDHTILDEFDLID